MSIRILIDLNVLIDALNKREPFFESSAKVLAAIETGRIEGWIAAHSVTTLFYLVAKDSSRDMARVHLTNLLQFLKVATVDSRVIEQALALPYRDFEDAVQMMAGVHAGVEYVVSRDLIGFKTGPLPVISPNEMLALLHSKEM